MLGLGAPRSYCRLAVATLQRWAISVCISYTGTPVATWLAANGLDPGSKGVYCQRMVRRMFWGTAMSA